MFSCFIFLFKVNMATPAETAPAATTLAAAAPATPAPAIAVEPLFALKIEPADAITFKSNKITEKTVSMELKITNNSKSCQVVKVRFIFMYFF